MKNKPTLTQDRLKQLLHYDQDTGVFIWARRYVKNGKKFNRHGMVAGCSTGQGYCQIMIDKTNHKAHRLAFLWMTGEIPVQIDHLNHIHNDNRWCNLSPSNYEENSKNIPLQSNNKSGFNGVFYENRRSKWVACVQIKGAYKHLGYYEMKDDAISARMKANKKYRFHDNHGLGRFY